MKFSQTLRPAIEPASLFRLAVDPKGFPGDADA
jgi:hypothetical protein